MLVLGRGPSDILGSGKRIVDWFIETFAGFVLGAGTYILLGAAVVLPIWLIRFSQGGSKSQLTILDRRDENFRTLKACLSSVGGSPVSRRCPRKTRGLHQEILHAAALRRVCSNFGYRLRTCGRIGACGRHETSPRICGNKPPVTRLVGALSSLPSQMPATRSAV